MRRDDLTGRRFGNLVVLYYVGVSRHGGAIWQVQCDCGVIKPMRAGSLKAGSTVSCGCFSRAQTTARLTTHGLARHPLYNTWTHMMRRCSDRQHGNWKDYGGRGITVYDAWSDVAVFIADIEHLIGSRPPGMTLDRIDNDGNYEPGNVRWATHAEQSANKTYAHERELMALRAEVLALRTGHHA